MFCMWSFCHDEILPFEEVIDCLREPPPFVRAACARDLTVTDTVIICDWHIVEEQETNEQEIVRPLVAWDIC
jgi:hypothetical protein